MSYTDRVSQSRRVADTCRAAKAGPATQRAICPLVARRGTAVTDCGRGPLAYAPPASGSEFAPSGALMGCARSERPDEAFADRGGADEPRPSLIIVSPERPSKACVWPGTVQREGRGRLDASRSEGRHRVTVGSPFVERRPRGASGTTSGGNSPKVMTSARTEPGSRRWRWCCRFRGRRARVVGSEP